MGYVVNAARGAVSIVALAATIVAPVAAPLAAQSVAATPDVVQVPTGQGRMVTLAAPMSDLFVANDAVADVQVRSPTQIYLFGKAPGQTTVYATNKAGRVVYSATIRVGNNITSVAEMLAVTMPDAQITATAMNGVMLLTGTVKHPNDVAEAERLVKAYIGEGTQVLSRLNTATPLQVNLQVKIAEVNRNFAKNIGMNLTTIDSTGGFKFGIGSGRNPAASYNLDPRLGLGVGSAPESVIPSPIDGTPTLTPGTNISQGSQRTTIGGLTKFLGLDILGALDLGEINGQVTTLANPNLTALSGETSSFLAGGEIPILVNQGLGAVAVEYKQYGVSLTYTPTVLSDGRISLRVRPEVSQLTSAGSVTIGGTQIPALTTRRAETTVELGSGQSMMIGGLMQNTHNNLIDKTPGAGDIPIIGSLFRSNAFQRNETELVIVVTPYLVKPVNNMADIHLPTDGIKAPTDLGRVLLGQLSTGDGAPRPVPTMAQGGGEPAIGAQATPAPNAALPAGPGLPPAFPVQRNVQPAQGPAKPAKGRPVSAAPGFTAAN
ncbi:type II and III secretion system protein family protein [Sphingomonas sp. BGYR3]|uniref:type II and III secretion system protein family protein n=1 Tax=Sphingomonas sp. BGYR3 TaxID=2975483 RepID=UPI0021A90B52|nr:type II and III secretion system protein family protein [Sphingomonas sp. BGYR3]MDG5489466.1 type II and III secretion system protein family protein [Sphingomonas sp. BGYR3]